MYSIWVIALNLSLRVVLSSNAWAAVLSEFKLQYISFQAKFVTQKILSGLQWDIVKIGADHG